MLNRFRPTTAGARAIAAIAVGCIIGLMLWALIAYGISLIAARF